MFNWIKRLFTSKPTVINIVSPLEIVHKMKTRILEFENMGDHWLCKLDGEPSIPIRSGDKFIVTHQFIVGPATYSTNGKPNAS